MVKESSLSVTSAFQVFRKNYFSGEMVKGLCWVASCEQGDRYVVFQDSQHLERANLVTLNIACSSA